MSQLPIIDVQTPVQRTWRSAAATALRCVLVLLIAIAIRVSANRPQTEQQDAAPGKQVDTAVAELLPDVEVISPPTAGGLQQLSGSNGRVIGFAITTLPQANDVVGYRGPSNVLLILNEALQVVDAKLISSEDTAEHVEIVRNFRFLKNFEGWTLGEANPISEIDAVSGATLTSLAIAEGIAVRLGGEKPSLRFPDPIQMADLQQALESTDGLSLTQRSDVESEIFDRSGQPVGRIIRTGPLADAISGYQGPSELLLVIGTDDRTRRIVLRKTFDNQPYAGYLNDEPYFWKTFQDKTLHQVAKIDLEAEQVEGVSGATMTSMAVAETILAAAAQYEVRQERGQVATQQRRIHWGYHDTGTVIVLLLGMTIGLTRLRGIRWLQKVWNAILVGYFGLVTGNLISLAVLLGWTAQGIAWRLAPGLTAVIAVSFILSAATKRNLYCSHICPHGAFQQLLPRPDRKANARLSARWSRMFWLPGVMLVAAVTATMMKLNVNLAAWEPFNAYIWYVTGFSSFMVAIISLSVASAVPMAYCRYGCGTGRLLQYVRHSARADRLTIADAVAVIIAVSAWAAVL